MASAGGSAKLVYPGGCQVRVIPGTVVSIGKQPPCTAPYDVRYNPPPHLFNNPLVPFAIGGAIGWASFAPWSIAAMMTGGRRISQLAAESSFGWLAKFVVIAIRDL